MKDSEIAQNPQDLKLLEGNLIDARQDDDVDTDDEILDFAYENCINDLKRAERRASRPDGSVNLSIARNYRIDLRAQNPDDYDRNGIFIERTKA